MEWYKIALYVIAGIAALYFFAGFTAAFIMALVIKRPRGRLARPDYEQMRKICGDFDFSEYDLMEKEEFTLSNMGADLKCVFIPAPESGEGRKKCIISAHGFGLNLIFSARYVSMFRALGYSAVIYDARGLGKSTGASSLGYLEKYDMKAIADWVRGRLGEDAVIGVHGESLGAITALEVLGVDPGIAFAIPDSCSTTVYKTFTDITRLPAFPFFSFLDLLSRLVYRVDMREIRPIDRVSASEVPILFICGTNDKLTPPGESEKLFAAAKNPLSRLEIFEGAWHTGAYAFDKERYEKAVGEFTAAAERIYDL